jgi:hypothetical protein
MPDAYVNTSRRAEDLADGRTIAPGEVVENLDADDQFNARLIGDGVLVPVDEKRASTKTEKRDS